MALGAGHAFKFTPAIGLALAELATGSDTTDDLTAFAVDATAVPRDVRPGMQIQRRATATTTGRSMRGRGASASSGTSRMPRPSAPT
ncbi:hypothetical protein HR12_31395 [Microbacterium sp. SUBG005]|nr:hypothetical protein HR12_31395 [Microbacterium sp. SUBG005]